MQFWVAVLAADDVFGIFLLALPSIFSSCVLSSVADLGSIQQASRHLFHSPRPSTACSVKLVNDLFLLGALAVLRQKVLYWPLTTVHTLEGRNFQIFTVPFKQVDGHQFREFLSSKACMPFTWLRGTMQITRGGPICRRCAKSSSLCLSLQVAWMCLKPIDTNRPGDVTDCKPGNS